MIRIHDCARCSTHDEQQGRHKQCLAVWRRSPRSAGWSGRALPAVATVRGQSAYCAMRCRSAHVAYSSVNRTSGKRSSAAAPRGRLASALGIWHRTRLGWQAYLEPEGGILNDSIVRVQVVVNEDDEAVAREHTDRPDEACIRCRSVRVELIAVAIVRLAVLRARVDWAPGQPHVDLRSWTPWTRSVGSGRSTDKLCSLLETLEQMERTRCASGHAPLST